MQLNILTTLYSLAALAQAASWVDTPENRQIAEFMLSNGGGDISTAIYNRTTAAALHSRADMRDNQWYAGKAEYFGWVVQVGRCMVYEYASSWTLPSPGDGNGRAIDYVATQFADTLASITGEGVSSMDMGGGWALTAVGSGAYLPKNIPWSLAYDMMYDASTAAAGWITSDNGAYWTLKDTAGDVIYTFLVWPLDAVGTNAFQVHEEF
ncbi:hypothetical protein NQ176_g1265 [Zarea fungicola]|uniref:Uncharacterized protein n=1 Tax=Zarea fungicola TaxID=93591 RepID=A0ACC1NTH2_9HYPO|nr:hypothetical protein NQ176_g1265 [Lecanicillium fungicola]